MYTVFTLITTHAPVSTLGTFVFIPYSKTCVKNTINGFQDQLSLNAGQKYCRMLPLGPSLSYHLLLRSLFYLFLSGRFTQVLLYLHMICENQVNNKDGHQAVDLISS